MLIATPNLCLDRTEFLAALIPGAVMRATSVEVTAGGKGVNVARVVRTYGLRPTIVGLVPDDDRSQLLDLLTGEGASVLPVATPGRIRQAIVMIEQQVGRITVLNEPGSVLAPHVWADYMRAVSGQLDGLDLLVCAGSLPPGAPVDGYGQLVELARAAGVATIVDTAPAPLRDALASAPDLVTPNIEEAEAAISGNRGDVLATVVGDTRARAEQAAIALCDLGAVRAAVTAGSDGVAFVDSSSGDGRPTWVPTVPVNVVSAVGAGDSFVAGLALSLFGGQDDVAAEDRWHTAIVRGTATASASCEQLRAGGLDPQRVGELIVAITKRLAG